MTIRNRSATILRHLRDGVVTVPGYPQSQKCNRGRLECAAMLAGAIVARGVCWNGGDHVGKAAGAAEQRARERSRATHTYPDQALWATSGGGPPRSAGTPWRDFRFSRP